MADLMFFSKHKTCHKNTVNYFYVFWHREDRFLEKFSRKIDFALWLFQHKKKETLNKIHVANISDLGMFYF